MGFTKANMDFNNSIFNEKGSLLFSLISLIINYFSRFIWAFSIIETIKLKIVKDLK